MKNKEIPQRSVPLAVMYEQSIFKAGQGYLMQH